MKWYSLFAVGLVVVPVFVFAQQASNLSEMASLLQSLQELVSNLARQVGERLPIVTATVHETDVTRDGIINERDWEFLRDRWFSADPVADINGDGVVNSVDFGLINRNWGKTVQ